MGKKGKKTRWRELPITLADKPYTAPDQQQGRHSTDTKPVNFAAAAGRRAGGNSGGHNGGSGNGNGYHHPPYQHQQPHRVGGSNHAISNTGGQLNATSTTVTFNEDEYTKITTPRQDVLFKKGYLGRRKNTLVPVINEVMNENEDILTPEAMGQVDEMCPPGDYIDPSALYFINGSGYEVYDPYTGNITVLMGPPPGPYPPAGHPMMAAMPYQTMPLQPVEWFNPTNLPHPGSEPWTPSLYQSYRHSKKHMSADAQQNGSAQSSEADGSVHELGSDDQQTLYQTPQPYFYPSYMFGAPMYNYNGVSIQVPLPQSPPSPSLSYDYTNGKRRKKKKRRKRGGVSEEYSDSSSEEQKSQSGASSDLILDSEKTSDSGVLTNNSGGSTPVNVIPVQLSHNAPAFHMDCPQPFEIIHGTPILVHHHPDHMAAFYQPITQYTDHLASIEYEVIPEEQLPAEVSTDDRPDGEPTAGYSAENSDSGISSPNSEVMVKESTEEKQSKSQTTNSVNGQTTSKRNRNKKSKQRGGGDKSIVVVVESITKTKNKEIQKSHHETSNNSGGNKKSSKIAKEPPIIKKLNARKFKCKTEKDNDSNGKCSSEKKHVTRTAIETVSDITTQIDQLVINPIDDEEFCSLECTPRSIADGGRFPFTKTHSVDSCDSVEEETFATAVNTGNSDTENEVGCRQDDSAPIMVKTDNDPEVTLTRAILPGPITEAVTKWLNDQGGLVLASTTCLQDDDTEVTTDDECDSEYDDFEEQPISPKNMKSNPCPLAPSHSNEEEGSRVACTTVAGGPGQKKQSDSSLLPSGICCLTQ
ncbi:uncharacterized protein LOC126903515 [Daktulosphaira vitifoliae]|uniref:uncharacterized protein LOC126903515 n=1 Tax=Daktulosphaira vitifoliae TaxID=58002 RepID=UPI0021AABAB1|nr:uncharacterized protein LOC126903515 [Daktulosphaira vitifoliae]